MARENQNIQLVIFDWAGTAIDFGSCAPATAFERLFQSFGIEVTEQEVRKPMGLNKREHLISMLSEPRLTTQWKAKIGRDWNDQDIDQLYADFVKFQLAAIENNSVLVPELLETVKWLRSQNIFIGTTTGYFNEAANAVLSAAQNQGFVPDAAVCANDVSQGRPAPWMIFEIMHQLKIYPSNRVLKIGDTLADIQAGRNAGCWSVGVCDSSSLIGLSNEAFLATSLEKRESIISKTATAFSEVGSHAALRSLAELPQLIETINQQLSEDTNVSPHSLPELSNSSN